MQTIAIYYLKLLPVITEAARSCGYAIGLHGSLERDLDLIAAPWVSDAKPPDELAEVIRQAVHGHVNPREDDGYFWAGCPGAKPHGRLVWSIHLGAGAYIDLSVMPRTNPPDLTGEEIVRLRQEAEEKRRNYENSRA